MDGGLFSFGILPGVFVVVNVDVFWFSLFVSMLCLLVNVYIHAEAPMLNAAWNGSGELLSDHA